MKLKPAWTAIALALPATLISVACILPDTYAATDCTPQTAWAGSESSAQHNGGTFVQIPVKQPITLTHLAVSLGYTPHPYTATGFGEVLLLAGISDSPLVMSDPLLPAMPTDPAFGQLNVTTTKSQPHNENPALSDGVVAARIVKGVSGTTLIDLPLNRPVPADGVLWVRYDSVSDMTLDPEIQLVASYQPGGC